MLCNIMGSLNVIEGIVREREREKYIEFSYSNVGNWLKILF